MGVRHRAANAEPRHFMGPSPAEPKQILRREPHDCPMQTVVTELETISGVAGHSHGRCGP